VIFIKAYLVILTVTKKLDLAEGLKLGIVKWWS